MYIGTHIWDQGEKNLSLSYYLFGVEKIVQDMIGYAGQDFNSNPNPSDTKWNYLK